MPEAWTAPDLTEEKVERLNQILDELFGYRGNKDPLFPKPEPFESQEEIDNLTEERAQDVRIAARRLLLQELLQQEVHWHEADDCGDYLIAATENWAALFGKIWQDDFQDEVAETKKFLTDFEAYPEGGCDGEVRYDLGLMGEGGLAGRINQHLGG